MDAARSRDIEMIAASEAAKKAASSTSNAKLPIWIQFACAIMRPPNRAGDFGMGRYSNRRHYSTTWGRTKR